MRTGEIRYEWLAITDVGVPLQCLDVGSGYRFLYPSESKAAVFLPSECLEASSIVADRCEFDALVERQGVEIFQIFQNRERNLQDEIKALGRIKREVGLAANDLIRASLLDDYLRKSDPDRISRGEADQLIERRLREAKKDLTLISAIIASFKQLDALDNKTDISLRLPDRPAKRIRSISLQHGLSVAIGEGILSGTTDVDQIRNAIELYSEEAGGHVLGNDSLLDDVFEALTEKNAFQNALGKP